MLPSEFLQRFGSVHPQTMTVPSGGTITIPPDPDRYLMVFWATLVGMRVRPTFDGATPPAGFTWNATDAPHIYTHALHGAMVNLGWVVQMILAGGDSDIIIVQGYMRP